MIISLNFWYWLIIYSSGGFMEEKRRYDGLDLIKLIAILMVIATHIPLYEYDFIKNADLGIYIQFFFKMVTQGVPLFFAVNGFLMFKKDTFDLKQHVWKMMKIFILSIFWSLVLIIINLLYDKTPLDRSVIVDLFLKTSGGSLYTGEIWFLQAMFSIYTVYPLLWLVFKNDKRIFRYLMYVLLCSLLINKALKICTLILENEIRIKQFNDTISFVNRYSILDKYGWFLLYFMIGGYLFDEIEKISKKGSIICFFALWIFMFVFSVILCVNKGQIYDVLIDEKSLLQISSIVMLFKMLLNYKKEKKIGLILCDIGMNTFGIYISHQFFIRIGRLFVQNDLFYSRFFIMLISLFFSYVFSKIVGRIRYINELIRL